MTSYISELQAGYQIVDRFVGFVACRVLIILLSIAPLNVISAMDTRTTVPPASSKVDQTLEDHVSIEKDRDVVSGQNPVSSSQRSGSETPLQRNANPGKDKGNCSPSIIQVDDLDTFLY